MKLSQATKYFLRVPVDLYDGTNWHLKAVKVSLQTFDRNTTRQDIGTARRLINVYGPLDPKWQMLRLPTGDIYLIANQNYDINTEGTYIYMYQIDEAPRDISIINFSTVDRASGVGGTLVENGPISTRGNIRRVTGFDSTTFDSPRFSQFDIEIPGALGLNVTTDSELEIEGHRYTVDENFPAGFITKIIGTRKSS